MIVATGLIVAALVSGASESEWGGDHARGEAALKKFGCLSCHSAGGNGGGEASDLALRTISNRQSPAGTAAEMWNHAPRMWDAMARGEGMTRLTYSEAEDVFAYFRSARYFDPMGEVIRGKAVFAEKGCSNCHALDSEGGALARGTPVGEWQTLFDTAAWTSSLWNHAATMLQMVEETGLEWPTLSEQEMVDLLLYLRTSVDRDRPINEMALSDVKAGASVFEERGCSDCHTVGSPTGARNDLAAASRQARTMSGLAAAMWSHIPQMYGSQTAGEGQLRQLTPSQVVSLASYLYSEGAFSERGNPAAGQRVFAKKGCATCHQDGGSTREIRTEERFNEPMMVSLAWSHGPSVRDELVKQGATWPEFSEREMENLIAYLNAP